MVLPIVTPRISANTTFGSSFFLIAHSSGPWALDYVTSASIPASMGTFPWVNIYQAPSTTSFFPFPVQGPASLGALLWGGCTGSAATHMVLLCERGALHW